MAQHYSHWGILAWWSYWGVSTFAWIWVSQLLVVLCTSTLSIKALSQACTHVRINLPAVGWLSSFFHTIWFGEESQAVSLEILFVAYSRGSDQFSCQILKIMVGSLAKSGQKKGVLLNPNFAPTQESPTLSPLPHLAKIGHQLYHGGGSIYSNATLTKKCPRQWITYPLGSTLMRAFLFMCCFCCKKGLVYVTVLNLYIS